MYYSNGRDSQICMMNADKITESQRQLEKILLHVFFLELTSSHVAVCCQSLIPDNF